MNKTKTNTNTKHTTKIIKMAKCKNYKENKK